jgi:predicted transcriptional regulator
MTVVLTENSSKRRDKLVIMAEIINIAKRGTSKTHIMFTANLSFSQLNLYIDLLSEANLLEKTAFKGKELYKSTQKGLEFMEKQCDVLGFLNNELGKKSVKTSFEFNPYNGNKCLLY